MASHNRLSLDGMTFGKLRVIKFDCLHVSPSGDKKSKWLCQCSCGNEVSVFGSSLTSGNSTSCGCVSKKLISETNRTHGASKSRTYRIWQAMLNRCRNKKSNMYYRYGGRGISVCDRWKSFENFLSDMGESPDGMSIDRINNDGNYEPGNCRWASKSEQVRNSTIVKMIAFGNRTMCLKDWASELEMDQASLAERLSKWPLERALTQPKMR